jgi:hypothetical protein
VTIIRTHGPDLWGVFYTGWLGGRVPCFTDDNVCNCLRYARQQRIY